VDSGHELAERRGGSVQIEAAEGCLRLLHIPEGRSDYTTPAETLRLHGLD